MPEPISYEYRMQLESLSSAGAVFERFVPSSQVIDLPKLTISVQDWDALSRPGYVSVAVKAVEAPAHELGNIWRTQP